MNEQIEIALIEDAKTNIANKTTSLQGEETISSLDKYRTQARFEQERRSLFSMAPMVLMHASELSEPNSYQSVDTPIGSLIVSRDQHGKAHILRNSCRHRGARIVSGKGCSKRLVCPYHAWSYSTDGELSNIPGQVQCFPNTDKAKNGLLRLGCVEQFGFIWLCPTLKPEDNGEAHLASHLGGMVEHLQWLAPQHLKRFKQTTKRWLGNWKLFAEGGLETYHFSFAHKGTIAPYFHNNIAVIDQIDQHFRVVMPTKSLSPSASSTDGHLSLHDYSHTLFYLLPSAALLIQKEHVDWIHFNPKGPDETEISVTTLIPSTADLTDPVQQQHWEKNHHITNETLDEDWALGESIQASINENALPYLQYGRNEWALHAFNQVIEGYMARVQTGV